MTGSIDEVLVLGAASWNTMLMLDSLPEPRPQMVVAQDTWDTVGGTSAGKALHLADLGVPSRLLAPIGDDEAGDHVRRALQGLSMEVLPTDRTERHVNLMTPQGARLSIYAAAPATTTPPAVDDLRSARAVVLDLAPWTRDVAVSLSRGDVPVWTDLHDIGPDAPWHEPFWRTASYVQCSADNLSAPRDFLHALVNDGVRLAICTLGSDGAMAVDAAGREYRVPPVPCEVVDTNGAGDAFFAGVLAATLAGESVEAALGAGARQATRALGTRDLGPGLVGI